MTVKFDQVWLWTDESETMAMGIKADKYAECDCLNVVEVTYHGEDDYSFAQAYWAKEVLPTNGDELWNMWTNHSCDGWSIRGDRESVLDDLGDHPWDDAFRLLERWAIDCPTEFITSPICDITRYVYSEAESEVFRKIAELKTEIDTYIHEVESEIKDAVNKRNEILEMRHIRLYNFLESRRHLVTGMFPGASIEVATGLDGVNVWFKRSRTMIQFGGYNYTKMGESYDETVVRDNEIHKAEQYNKVLTSWDAIQENIFDQNLYEALSEKMTEQVVKARERLSKARAELAEVK